MSNAKITIKLYNAPATVHRLAESDKIGKFLASEWSRYFAKYTPMQEGILASNITIDPFKVTYNSPYAHYQWEGKLYVDPITGKGAFYDKDYGFWSRPGVPKVPTNIPLNYSKEQNPLATSHWEVPAFEMYKNIVAKSVSEYIRRNV